MNLRIITVVFAALVALATTTAAEARTHHHHTHRTHHAGSCDGIHRCRCGSTQANHFNLPRIYNGHNLWQAAEWPRAFPHTIARPGVVMYQHGGGPTGHVSRIVQVTGQCSAIVADDAGQYERNICSRGATFVAVDGNSNAASTTAFYKGTTTYHSKRYKQHRHMQVALAYIPDFGRPGFSY